MLLNPIHINQSETDVNVSDINKWANSRDPEGTAARQGEGAKTHLCYHMGFIRKDYIFTPYLALHSLLGLKNAACGIQREGFRIRARTAAFGKGRMMAGSRVGLKENQVLCPSV